MDILTADEFQNASLQFARAKLRILATSDLHMHLATHDYYRDQPDVSIGLLGAAELISAARAETPNCLLVDNGDFLQGSPLGDFVVTHQVHPNPMVEAMNRLGYDAVNLGNHEFSCGLEYLKAALVAANFPCISANVLGHDTKLPMFAPFAIVQKTLTAYDGTRHDLKIGLVGVLPPQTQTWEAHVLGGALTTSDMVDAVKQTLPKVYDAGADIVIALAHCGIGKRIPEYLAENTALAIAGLPGVSAIIMGHVHRLFPGPSEDDEPLVDFTHGSLHGVPAVMPGFFGSHLGQIDLELGKSTAGWRVLRHRSSLLAAKGIDLSRLKRSAEGRAVFSSIRSVHRATRRWADTPIGKTGRDLHSYFALVADSPALQLISAAQADFVTSRLAGSPWDHLPVVSAAAPFRAGGQGGPNNYSHVRAGPFRIRHATDLYLHPNRIMAFLVTGRDLRHWLSCSARIFCPVIQGKADQPLHDTSIPSFHFDAIHGLTYSIRLGANGGLSAGVGDIFHNGKKIDDDQNFVLATNSYRGGGSGGFAADILDQAILSEPRLNRDVLIDFVQRRHFCPEPAPPAWSFAPLPGTSVTFDTSPAALEYLDDVSHLAIEPIKETDAGFMRFRIWL